MSLNKTPTLREQSLKMNIKIGTLEPILCLSEKNLKCFSKKKLRRKLRKAAANQHMKLVGTT